MATVFLSLGSNLGDREQNLQKAVAALEQGGVHVVEASRIIETDPFEAPAQPAFLNAVVQATTNLSPEEVLDLIGRTEAKLGRKRHVFRGPRLIDIDILLYDDVKLVSRRLVIPHPRMLERPFVTGPLQEIAPELCASLKT